MKIIKQGAEAILYIEKGNLIKERIKKSYRLEEIDSKIRKFRTKREAKLLQKTESSPKVLEVDESSNKIIMEYIQGDLLKDTLDAYDKEKRIKICKQIGEEVADLHDNNIIHGDLTTSNMILKDDKVYFIDFGLGFISDKIEHKAVDIRLFKQALESKHYKHFEECFQAFLQGYSKSKNYKSVIIRLNQVEMRGRYKSKNG